jgi:Uma2 family endonuclease
MVVAAPVTKPVEQIEYPSRDGAPIAETYDHFYAIAILLEMLRQYLIGKPATVLGNQFLYYAQGFPRMRVAPDVMVIFDVAAGGRDNYKIWEEGQVSTVIFEITSPSTQLVDTGFKRDLYAQMGVQGLLAV